MILPALGWMAALACLAARRSRAGAASGQGPRVRCSPPGSTPAPPSSCWPLDGVLAPLTAGVLAFLALGPLPGWR